MISGFNPYPAYRDSCVSWLGKIPEHWQVMRNKCFLQEVSDRSGDGSEELLMVSQYTGVTPRQKGLTGEGNLPIKESSLVGYKRVIPGDLVVNIMLAWNGSLGVSPVPGIVSPSYCVFRTKSHAVKPRFLHYLLRTPLFTGAFKTVSTGVVDSRLRLYPGVFLGLPLVIPPVPEQNAIVRFLDWVDRQIRRVIRARQRRIKLLEEYKQALIYQAVTGQTDVRTGKLYPAYKDSNVEWLGQVPEHWEVRKLRALFTKAGSGTTPSGEEFYGGDIPWVVTGDLNDSVLPNTTRTVNARALENFSALRLYPKHSLVIAMYGATIGKTAILGIEACTNQACCVLAEPRKGVLVRFIQSAVISAKGYLVRQGYGGGQPNINSEIVHNLRVPVPLFEDQTAIVEYLDDQAAKIDAAIAATRREIELLQEYRTRLIADAVTGKVDVREVAAQLPEEPPEEEPEWTGADEIAEAEPEDDATDGDAAAEELAEEETEP